MRQDNLFKNYKKQTNQSVKNLQKKISKNKDKCDYIEYQKYPLEEIKLKIINLIQDKFETSKVDNIDLSLPPEGISGDFCFEVFSLAKKIKTNPNQLAQAISQGIKNHNFDLIEKAIAKKGFVNLFLNKKAFYEKSLKCIYNLGNRFGENNLYAGKKVVIDYSAPNIAKPIGVGHLRSTIIGQALANLYENSGFISIKDNHIGDWGTQFGSLIYAYQKWGDKEKIQENPIPELKKLYVKFHKQAKENPKIKDKAREYFLKLENKDPELIKIWQQFRDLSLKEFNKVYKKLGINFDLTIGESFYIDKVDQIVKDCLQKDLCYIDEKTGAVAVPETNNIPSFLLQKKDGASVYLSRDLATLRFRIKTFKPDAILYVVGNEQKLNFKQLFALAKSAGYTPENIKLKHIGFGMVLWKGKKMSTRKGRVIELNVLIEKAIQKAKQILLNKQSDYKKAKINEIAKTIGIGAIIYNDLKQTRNKDISFNWQKMLSLKGGSAVYLQYTYTRIQSIIDKLSNQGFKLGKINDIKDISFKKDIEFEILQKLMFFPKILLKAQEQDLPHFVCKYLEELAQLFNAFYNGISINRTQEKDLKTTRLWLANFVGLTIKKGLSLLSIDVPEKM